MVGAAASTGVAREGARHPQILPRGNITTNHETKLEPTPEKLVAVMQES